MKYQGPIAGDSAVARVVSGTSTVVADVGQLHAGLVHVPNGPFVAGMLMAELIGVSGNLGVQVFTNFAGASWLMGGITSQSTAGAFVIPLNFSMGGFTGQVFPRPSFIEVGTSGATQGHGFSGCVVHMSALD